jgi:hypothetical protein
MKTISDMEMQLDGINTDGTYQWPKTPKASPPSVNASFGDAGLIDDKHLRFQRQSGIPHGYFPTNRDLWAERSIKAICALSAILVCLWFLLSH